MNKLEELQNQAKEFARNGDYKGSKSLTCPGEMSILEKIADIGLNKMVNQMDRMFQKHADMVYPEDMMAWEEIKHIAQSNIPAYSKLPAINAVAERWVGCKLI